MKVWTLMENTACRHDLAAEHGLSLYIETKDHRILFDTGQSGAFADNADKMGIDLSRVDLMVLSHGHYDHGGGLFRFLERNTFAPIYLSRHALEPHYNGQHKYIGLDPALAACGRLVFTGAREEIGDGLTLLSCNERQRPFPTDPFGLTVMENGKLCPEDFRHEQYLLVEEQGKRICFSGCSHKGILNIVRWFTPDVLVGGFHFMQLDPAGSGRNVLEASADVLLQCNTRYYTGHCTGTAQYEYMKRIMGHRLEALSAGSCFEI